MGYFDALQFIHGGVVSHCEAYMDQSFPDVYSIQFFLSGRMYYGLNGGARTIVTSPTMFWHHPAHIYQYGSLDAEGWHHHYIVMKGARAQSLLEEGFMPLAEKGLLPVADGRIYSRLFSDAVSVIMSSSRKELPEAVLAVERILWLAMQECKGPRKENGRYQSVEEVIRAVEEDPIRDYDFKREASGQSMSYSHFRRLFTQICGESPHGHLLQCRMIRAARLLANGGVQIKQVAQHCGYDDPAEFSRQFRLRLGVSPREYCRMCLA